MIFISGNLICVDALSFAGVMMVDVFQNSSNVTDRSTATMAATKQHAKTPLVNARYLFQIHLADCHSWSLRTVNN